MTGKPKEPGHYWAKWIIADEGTADAAEVVPSSHWEVVGVYENRIDREADDYLTVQVAGVERSQSIDNFIWGPGPLPPPAALN
ncbi:MULTISPECIES: hypothetical protein [unclassified Bradyrhizobium]|uniref:hypothetical protein n=1 Tax=unclassified Bradyrhizobium TaxID=2631580 RepID=UPI000B213B34|nr:MULTISPECIES: hypothetical protein [unclassified Bradyrhizobium]